MCSPELQAKREALVGGGDPALSTRPLDVAWARRHLTLEQHTAGGQFAYLWRSGGARRAHVSAVDLDPDTKPGHDGEAISERDMRIRAEFNSARNHVVRRFGTFGLHTLQEFVIFDRWYDWVTTTKGEFAKLPASQLGIVRLVRDILTCLHHHFANGRRPQKVRHTIRHARDF